MLADLYRKLNYATSPDSTVTTRLTAGLNETLQELLSEPGLAAWIARQEPMATMASVANQAVYNVPITTARIDAITERSNQRRLQAQSVDWYRSAAPDPTIITGTPDTWIPLGFQPVAVQPSDASQLFVKSTSASDGAGTTAFLEGIRTGGYPTTLSVAMNGTTAVSLSASLTDILQVTKFYVSVAAVGTITLQEDSGAGTTLATIPIGQTFARYVSFALYPTPASVITYYLEGERHVPDMVNSTDEPPFPARFHRVLVDGALWREWEKQDDDRAPRAQQRYRAGVADLRYFLTCAPDFLPVAGAQRLERSRLGAWFRDGAGVR